MSICISATQRQYQILPRRSGGSKTSAACMEIASERKLSDHFWSLLQKNAGQGRSKKWTLKNRSEDSRFLKSAKVFVIHLGKQKKPISRCQQRQRAGIKNIGGESASPTNPKKCCAGKLKTKYFRPSKRCIYQCLKMYKCMAPDGN